MKKSTMGILVLVAIGVILLSTFSMQSLVTSTRTYNVNGETVSVSAHFGDEKIPPTATSSSDYCWTRITDNGTPSITVSVSGATCYAQTETLDVKITSLDLSKYQKVVIRRAWDASVYAENRYATMNSAIMKQPGVEFRSLNTGLSWQKAIGGDVYITNDGNSITVKSTEGTYLFDASQPLYFENVLVSGATFNDPSYITTHYTIKAIEKTPFPIPQPGTVDSPKALDQLLGQLFAFLSETFAKLKEALGLSISGATIVNPGATQAYVISMPEPYAGSYDYTQGKYTTRYCGAGLVDKNNVVISETGFTPCTTGYNKTFSANIPAGKYTDYVVVAVMTETKQNYANGVWTTEYQNKVIQQEALSITSKVVVPPTTTTAPTGIGAFLAQLWNWIVGLFS